MALIYKSVNTEQELTVCVNVIRESFATVAEQFRLTKENAPTNPAFIEMRHLQKMQEKGIVVLSTQKLTARARAKVDRALLIAGKMTDNSA